jgi:predicted ribosome quality control (RQC) complex YloA/Tae2 family protein
MIRNYFSLYELTRELKETLEGGYVFEAFSQEKGELRLSLIAPTKKQFALSAISGDAKLALHLSPDSVRQRRNTASLMKPISDKQILSIRISDCERIIYFDLEDSLSIAFQLFSADTNFFLIQNGIVLEAFKKNSEFESKPFAEKSLIPILRTLEKITSDFSLFESSLKAIPISSLQKELPKVLAGFDATLAREAIFRAKELAKPDAFTLQHLFESVQDIFFELISPEPKVCTAIEDSNESVWFSIINETHRPPHHIEPFEKISEAMRRFSYQVHRTEHFGKELKLLKKNLERMIQKTGEQVKALSEQSEKNRGAKYEEHGHLLIANFDRIQKGASEIAVENFFHENQSEIITIDPKKSARENAELYFTKAKKSRQNEITAKKRLIEFSQNQIEQKRLLSELAEITKQKEFGLWQEKNLHLLKKFGLISEEQAEKQSLFKRFQISPNAELWVGKNAKNNDVLTFKYAKPNDWWFHARGVAGSHCVLKTSKKPNRDELERAAQIAAYYSSARSSDLAPVICTEKKFVRKPKGSTVGSVTVEREEVLIVKPQLGFADSD